MKTFKIGTIVKWIMPSGIIGSGEILFYEGEYATLLIPGGQRRKVWAGKLNIKKPILKNNPGRKTPGKVNVNVKE